MKGRTAAQPAGFTECSVRGQVITGAGHWLMEEAPDVVMPAIEEFVA